MAQSLCVVETKCAEGWKYRDSGESFDKMLTIAHKIVARDNLPVRVSVLDGARIVTIVHV